MKYGTVLGVPKKISKLVIGSDSFSEDREEAAYELLDAFFEVGGNTIDMAHIYGGGAGQRVVGRWMKARGNRDEVVLFDKGCHHSDRNRVTPEDIDADLSANLERLQVDCVDLFSFHRDDPTYPVGPLVEKLNEHLRVGRVCGFGGSNWTTERVAEFNSYAAEHGLQGFSLNNPNMSLATVNEPHWANCHSITPEEKEWHRANQFPLFSWSSQGGGFFAGRESADIKRVYWNETNWKRKERAEKMAAEKGVPVVGLCLAYVLNHPFPTWALIGPRKPDELSDSLAGLDVELATSELHWLEGG